MNYPVVDVSNARYDIRSMLIQCIEGKGPTGQLALIKAPNLLLPGPVALHGQPIFQSGTRGSQ